MSSSTALRELLEPLYARYNRADFHAPDPVAFVHRYAAPEDREIVAFFAAGLAYGRVASIGQTLENFLPRLTESPAAFVDGGTTRDWERAMHGFQHRWTHAREVVAVLEGMRAMRREVGSLQAGFLEGLAPDAVTVNEALTAWVARLRPAEGGRNSLLADPSRGSACKRLHLFLRWMVREDEIDPGGWREVPAAKLVIPVDVHMHRVGQAMRFTKRTQADGRAALEITAGFRRICPEDPVRYDFALTRAGILEGVDLRQVGGARASVEARLRALVGEIPASPFP